MEDTKSQKNLKKNGKKTNFNVPVEPELVDLFEEWQSKLPGLKGEKLAGALRAIMAIHAINADMLFKLMDTSTTVALAKSILIQGVIDYEINRLLAPLPDDQRASLLLRAKQEAEKVVRKK